MEQEKKDMMARQTGLEEDLRVKQEDLGKTKVCVYVSVHVCTIILKISIKISKDSGMSEKA